jgi:hypothetical protein
MDLNTRFFSWIISVLLKIYGYEYEYARYYPWGALNKTLEVRRKEKHYYYKFTWSHSRKKHGKVGVEMHINGHRPTLSTVDVEDSVIGFRF